MHLVPTHLKALALATFEVQDTWLGIVQRKSANPYARNLVLVRTWSSSDRGDWCFQVCRDEVHKDQVPDLPYLNATTWFLSQTRFREPDFLTPKTKI